MSFSFFINMEPLLISIAEDNISKMWENMEDNTIIGFLDHSRIEDNFRYGFIAITAIVNFVESFLNTIIRDCIYSRSSFGSKGYTENEESIDIEDRDKKLKQNIVKKIDFICNYYGVERSSIKGGKEFFKFSELNKIRNDLVHYKIKWECEGISISDFSLSKGKTFKNFFQKKSLSNELKNAKELCEKIAISSKLTMNRSAQFIECNGRDGLTSCVFDSNKILIDPTRIL